MLNKIPTFYGSLFFFNFRFKPPPKPLMEITVIFVIISSQHFPGKGKHVITVTSGFCSCEMIEVHKKRLGGPFTTQAEIKSERN